MEIKGPIIWEISIFHLRSFPTHWIFGQPRSWEDFPPMSWAGSRKSQQIMNARLEGTEGWDCTAPPCPEPGTVNSTRGSTKGRWQSWKSHSRVTGETGLEGGQQPRWGILSLLLPSEPSPANKSPLFTNPGVTTHKIQEILISLLPGKFWVSSFVSSCKTEAQTREQIFWQVTNVAHSWKIRYSSKRSILGSQF